MRCPRCNNEFDKRCERCPSCGLSASLAKPDSDTMTRVKKNNSIMTGDKPEQCSDELYTSFSPVLRFDKPMEETPILPDNPASNFKDTEFHPVEFDNNISNSNINTDDLPNDIDEAELRHIILSREIHRLANNKEDDLLAEYYFSDGISDLEKYKLAKSFSELETPSRMTDEEIEASAAKSAKAYLASHSGDDGNENGTETEMQFPKEQGFDVIFTKIGEVFDRIALRIKSFFKDLYINKLGKYYRSLDEATKPKVDNILDKVYYSRFKNLKRQQTDNSAEKRQLRKVFWGSIFSAASVLLLFVIILIFSLTDAVNGKWVVSYDTSNKPNIIMEFSAGGKASISVKADDGWHVHKKGSYKTQKKNGHDMLIITYDDGSVSRLYYTINGREGKFINVETNVESTYMLK